MSDTFTFDFEDLDNAITEDEAPELTVEKPETKEEATPTIELEEPVEETLSESDKAEYLIIYDSIMFEDKFEKTYKLGSKYSARFSTRSTDADMTISRQLDKMSFSSMHAFQTMSAVLTMSYSLIMLNGKDLSNMSSVERYNYLRGKSSHLLEVLTRHMVKFDALVRNALEYGEENF